MPLLNDPTNTPKVDPSQPAISPSPAPSPASPSPSASSPSSSSTPAPSAQYAPASESGDAQVHQLLAQRVALQMNRDAITPDPKLVEDQQAAIDAQLAQVTKQLNALGYQ
jgi:hypothetical protein